MTATHKHFELLAALRSQITAGMRARRTLLPTDWVVLIDGEKIDTAKSPRPIIVLSFGEVAIESAVSRLREMTATVQIYAADRVPPGTAPYTTLSELCHHVEASLADSHCLSNTAMSLDIGKITFGEYDQAAATVSAMFVVEIKSRYTYTAPGTA